MAEEITKSEKKPILSVGKKYWATMAFLVVIIAAGMFVFATQPLISPKSLYAFATTNFNSTLTNGTISNPNIYSILNSTITLTNGSVVKFPQNGKTYLYYFGADYCSECQVESYVLWHFLNSGEDLQDTTLLLLLKE